MKKKLMQKILTHQNLSKKKNFNNNMYSLECPFFNVNLKQYKTYLVPKPSDLVNMLFSLMQRNFRQINKKSIHITTEKNLSNYSFIKSTKYTSIN